MPKVLVVDDAQFMRMRCARLLTEKGFEVVEAENGAEAVRVYQEQRPDVVLMDITMPEMDGLTALKEIRRHDPNARVAMLTALGQQGIVIEAIKSGARDFIVKPFDADRVLQAVNKLLS
ncbi:MAG: response regulator [Chloroflexi bacterium]|nr:response regulator [Chloroflexota bacterium]